MPSLHVRHAICQLRAYLNPENRWVVLIVELRYPEAKLNMLIPAARLYEPLSLPVRMLLAFFATAAVFASALFLDFNIPFLGYGVAAGFLFHLAIRPTAREVLSVLGFALVLGFLSAYFHLAGVVHLNFTFVLGMLGLASFLVLALRAINSDGQSRERALWALAPATVLVFFILGSQHSLNMGSMLRPRTYDLYAFLFDGSLGFQPSFAMGKLFLVHPWLYQFGAFTYTGITFAMAILYAIHLHYRQTFTWDIIEVLFGAALIGYLFFTIFPVCGPRYGFPAYYPNVPIRYDQLHLVLPEMIAILPRFPRNGVPSLHMSWAILMWWSCRRLPRWTQLLGAVYVLITITDTLGVGEHYAFDLIVAFPFSLSMQALLVGGAPLRSQQRWLPALAGFAVFLGWLVLVAFGGLRFLEINPAIPWTLVALSTIGSIVWAYRLPLAKD